ncbi:MAG: hypothetical protein ACI83N_001207, partial [Hydrogenophaga sp.]
MRNSSACGQEIYQCFPQIKKPGRLPCRVYFKR